MGIFDILGKEENFVAIDIGAKSVKLLELDLSDDRPQLIKVAMSEFEGEIFSNQIVSKPDKVAEVLGALLDENEIADRRVVTAVPGPSVFTKKIRMPKADLSDLRASIEFEASNFIPHSIDAVKLDFHIIGEASKSELDVLVVAVKDEIIDSFTDCLILSGLETAIVDVDYFALQNCYDLNYPELLPKTVALLNIGARYSAINICREGQSLFTGDISIGGNSLSDELTQALKIDALEAERLKDAVRRGVAQGEVNQDAASEIIYRNVEFIASELNRQISFFWNAAGAEEGIDKILISGGGSLLPGLERELSEKTGISCGELNPFKEVDCGSDFQADYLAQVGPFVSIAVGLAIRQTGDKILEDYL